jgi:hypothetical protein
VPERTQARPATSDSPSSASPLAAAEAAPLGSPALSSAHAPPVATSPLGHPHVLTPARHTGPSSAGSSPVAPVRTVLAGGATARRASDAAPAAAALAPAVPAPSLPLGQPLTVSPCVAHGKVHVAHATRRVGTRLVVFAQLIDAPACPSHCCCVVKWLKGNGIPDLSPRVCLHRQHNASPLHRDSDVLRAMKAALAGATASDPRPRSRHERRPDDAGAVLRGEPAARARCRRHAGCMAAWGLLL